MALIVQNPLFYQNVVPLNRDAHRDLRLKPLDRPLDYARESSLIPALIDEFGAAANELAIAFLPGTGEPAAVFITGIKPGKNLVISEDGLWSGAYVPAYLRRYPFIVGDVPDSEPILCIDDAYPGFTRDDGWRLFSASGEAEPSTVQALELAINYRAAADRTRAFSARLQELGLFRAVTLAVEMAGEHSATVHGLLAVDEQSFDALPDDVIVELHRAGYLKLIFAHILSLRAVSKLTSKISDIKILKSA